MTWRQSYPIMITQKLFDEIGLTEFWATDFVDWSSGGEARKVLETKLNAHMRSLKRHTELPRFRKRHAPKR